MSKMQALQEMYPELKFIPKYHGPKQWGATLINSTVYYNPSYHDIYKVLKHLKTWGNINNSSVTNPTSSVTSKRTSERVSDVYHSNKCMEK